jgi:hypothetical protein
MSEPRFRCRCDTCGADVTLGVRARTGWEDRHDATHDYTIDRVDEPDPDNPLRTEELTA